jgi:hypothetical protein
MPTLYLPLRVLKCLMSLMGLQWTVTIGPWVLKG